MGDRDAGSQDRRVVQDAVEAGVVVADRFRQVVRGGLVQGREVCRHDDGFRGGLRDDAVEDRFQLGARAPEQHHVRSVACVGQRGGAADAGAGARDQHHPVSEEVGGRTVAGRVASGHGEVSLRAWTT